MKRSLTIVLVVFVLHSIASAQSKSAPVYLLFKSGCMNVLDYKYAYASGSMRSYSIRPDAASPDVYFFNTEGEPLEKSVIPEDALDCNSIELSRSFVEAVNAKRKVMYIVQATQEGCNLYRVSTASMITHSRDVFTYRGPEYAFAFDTADMVYNKNLAPVGASFTIYLEGIKIYECRDEYQFHVEPKKSGGNETEFHLIPDMGITFYRSGEDETASDENQYQLNAYNNYSKKEYIDALCEGKNLRPKSYSTNSSSKTTKTTKKSAFREDPEIKSLQNEDGFEVVTTAANRGVPQLAECPYEPGPGYHIVQPGDNLIGISRAYDVPVSALLKYNDLKNPDRLEVCQIIYYAEDAEGPKRVVKPETYSQKKKKPETKVQNQKTYWGADVDSDEEETTRPATYNTKTKKDDRNLKTAKYNKRDAWIHVVRKGESLYSISRMYDLDEDYLREVNNYSLDEKVILRIGDKLVLAYCTYDDDEELMPFEYGERIDPSDLDRSYVPEQRSTPASTAKKGKTKGSIEIVDDDPFFDKKPVGYATPSRSTASKKKSSSNGDTFNDLDSSDRSEVVRPKTSSYKSGRTEKPTVKPLTKPSSYDTGDADVYYQDHIVRDGDTYAMIARMYGVKLQELLKANKAVDENETLIPAQSVVVPRRFSEYSQVEKKKEKTSTGSKRTRL